MATAKAKASKFAGKSAAAKKSAAKKAAPSKFAGNGRKSPAKKKVAAKKIPAKKKGRGSRLSETEKLMKLLTRKRGCTIADAATRLGKTEGTIRSMITNIRTKRGKGAVKSMGQGRFIAK